jgi:methylated-DNA-[protein]-cysteine S-methyltransferase
MEAYKVESLVVWKQWSNCVESVFYSRYESPIGPLLLAGSREGLRLVRFGAGKRPAGLASEWIQKDQEFREVVRQLKLYFGGKLEKFDLPLAMTGTDFQKRVWMQLLKIPYGETCSYRSLAENVGSPKAVRAVGAANGANPIPIIVPCHRVIGNDGSLTGFGGGLPLKKRLLELESRQLKLI